jgi:phosphoglycolate phosphatase
MNDSLEQIFEQITAKIIIRKTPFIIGINGFDGAGKTVFTKKYHQFLLNQGYKSHIIHLDDFHNNLEKRREGPNEIQAYIDNAFNLDLVELILKSLKNEGKFDQTLTLLNLETDTYNIEKHFTIENYTIVLLEGVLLYRDQINPYFDLRIFLDVTTEVSLSRNISREFLKDPKEVRKRFEIKYSKIQNWYYNSYKPHLISDVVINNNDYNNPVII